MYNNHGGPYASNQCCHPDKVSGAPNPSTNPTQPGQDITRGSQNEASNTLKLSNFYYDGNTNLPGQGDQITRSLKQMGPSTSEDLILQVDPFRNLHFKHSPRSGRLKFSTRDLVLFNYNC